MIGTYQNQWPPQKEHLLQKESFISKLKRIAGSQKFPPSLPGCWVFEFSFSGFSCADASHICQVLEGHRGTEVRDPEHPSLVEYTPGKTNILNLRKYIHPCIPGETSTQTIKFLASTFVFMGVTVANWRFHLGFHNQNLRLSWWLEYWVVWSILTYVTDVRWFASADNRLPHLVFWSTFACDVLQLQSSCHRISCPEAYSSNQYGMWNSSRCATWDHLRGIYPMKPGIET